MGNCVDRTGIVHGWTCFGTSNWLNLLSPNTGLRNAKGSHDLYLVMMHLITHITSTINIYMIKRYWQVTSLFYILPTHFPPRANLLPSSRQLAPHNTSAPLNAHAPHQR